MGPGSNEASQCCTATVIDEGTYTSINLHRRHSPFGSYNYTNIQNVLRSGLSYPGRNK